MLARHGGRGKMRLYAVQVVAVGRRVAERSAWTVPSVSFHLFLTGLLGDVTEVRMGVQFGGQRLFPTPSG